MKLSHGGVIYAATALFIIETQSDMYFGVGGRVIATPKYMYVEKIRDYLIATPKYMYVEKIRDYLLTEEFRMPQQEQTFTYMQSIYDVHITQQISFPSRTGTKHVWRTDVSDLVNFLLAFEENLKCMETVV